MQRKYVSRLLSGAFSAVILLFSMRIFFQAQLRIIDSPAGSDMTKKPAVRQGLLIDALVSIEETIRRQEEMEEYDHKK